MVTEGPSLAEGPACRKHERETRLIPVAGSGRVLEQPDVVDQDVAGHRPRRVLVTGVLIVDPERTTRVLMGTSLNEIS